MSAAVPVEPCRHCRQPTRIDTWCATEACRDRVEKAQQEERERIFGALADGGTPQ